ncbi:TKL protein kinase [Saprolegnia diclina VS20]|uniref:TKL protein kinase n=1 Tax=Saprolegnia diclina (strain VS20) TaxID=1156394 RepID=T0PWT9_SAPDV|nr:TKL protein kinase [Saprolegnia diclina VS20]EQC25470.1 TKL protein kinase [Saprolegnia diclina VS20]|eukprot:XP_008621098.1 TKL protein kinase [Saprolegnia diclina VS20]
MTTCPYAGAGNAILAADSYCDAATCVLDSSCRIVERYAAANTSFTGISALGNLLAYNATKLLISNATGAIDVQNVMFPTTLTSLQLYNFTSIDVVRLAKALPSSLQTFAIVNASALTLPSTFVWPSAIKNLRLVKLGLRQIPPNLPSALRSLSLYNNSITSLDGLPPSLTWLEMGENRVTSVVNYDWTNMTYVSFEANPLQTFAFVKLSPKLVTFDIQNIQSLSNISLSSDSCDALDLLSPYNASNNAGYSVSGDINADTTACANIGGSLRRLWPRWLLRQVLLLCRHRSLALALIGACLAYLIWRHQRRTKDKKPPTTKDVFDANPPVWHEPRDMECVLEYMNRGNLQDYLARHSPTTYTWAAKLEAIVSVVRGLIYLHTFDPPIIHRDLRSRNVLLDADKGTKINDFGSSRETSEHSMTNGVGSYQWAAPELILGSLYNTSVDIYSFGVLLTEFSTHHAPYARTLDPSTGRVLTQDKVMQLVTKGQLVPDFDWARSPIWLIEIAQRCLATEPEKRPTAVALAGLLDKHQFEVTEA